MAEFKNRLPSQPTRRPLRSRWWPSPVGRSWRGAGRRRISPAVGP